MRHERARATRICARALILVTLALVAPTPAAAQDTPEMLAAMRAAMPPVPDEVPTWEELSPELRAQVPVLEIGMHRWHEDPSERFVLIGGRRVNEGDVAGQQLWLREIRRDGIVLQFGDVFFLRPL
jgi:general secretion pathway protein B